MTTDQYSELIEFLAERFRAIDQRFDGIDQRFDGIDQRFDGIDQRIADSRRHAVVLFEQAQANLNVVAEGLGARVDRLQQRMAGVEVVLRDGLADHEQRLQELEGGAS